MTGHYTASNAVVLGWLCWWPVSKRISGRAVFILKKNTNQEIF
jgi:hypothetical protein